MLTRRDSPFIPPTLYLQALDEELPGLVVVPLLERQHGPAVDDRRHVRAMRLHTQLEDGAGAGEVAWKEGQSWG